MTIWQIWLLIRYLFKPTDSFPTKKQPTKVGLHVQLLVSCNSWHRNGCDGGVLFHVVLQNSASKIVFVGSIMLVKSLFWALELWVGWKWNAQLMLVTSPDLDGYPLDICYSLLLKQRPVEENDFPCVTNVQRVVHLLD